LATATIIPVVVLAYVFTLRLFSASWEVTKARAELLPVFTTLDGIVLMIIVIAPVASVVAGLFGEGVSLSALYTGHPTPSDARWTVTTLIVMGIAIPIHIFALGVTRYYRWILQRRDEARDQDDRPDLGYL
jgi:hypothetical protein